MAITAATRTDIIELVVLATNGAPGVTLLNELAEASDGGATLTEIAAMLTSSAAFKAKYPSLQTNEEFASEFLDNIVPGIDAVSKDIGVTTIAGLLNGGSTHAEILVASADFLSNTPTTDADFGAYAALFQNRVAVAEYHTVTLELDSDLASAIASVTADPASVTAAKDALDSGGGPIDVDNEFMLTVGQDTLVGNSADNTFTSKVVQNDSGFQVNTLGSGDSLNGAAGLDTLNATVTTGAFIGGGGNDGDIGSIPIQPSTSSVEVALFEAVNNDINNSTTVYINAKDMLDVDAIGSWRSDANLVIQNMTTKDSDGSIGSINDMTIWMGYTGNNDTLWDESDLTVYFDQDYLDPTTQTNFTRPTVDIRLMNEDKYDIDYVDGLRGIDIEALAGVYVERMKITLNGVDYQLAPLIDESPGPGSAANVDYIKTYPELLVAVQAAIVQLKLDNPVSAGGDPALQSLTAVLGDEFLADISPVFGVGQRVGTSILLSVEGSTDGAFDQNGDPVISNSLDIESSRNLVIDPLFTTDIPNSNRYERTEAFDAVPSEDLLPINVNLEKVGLAGDGGELIIGSMFKNSANSWSDLYDGKGIAEFEVTVSGASNKPSSLSGLHSTGNNLKEVNVLTNAAQTDTFASLTIGNSNTGGLGSTPTASNASALKDVQTFNASALKGDLNIWAALTSEVTAKYMTLVDDADDATADNVQFTYTGGTGNDYINLHLNSANLSAAGTTTREDFGLTVNGGAGDDELVTRIGDGSSTGPSNWYANSVINANLAVNADAGNDTVRTLGAGNFVIDAGADDDAVYTDNTGLQRATYVFNVADGDAVAAGDQFALTNLLSQDAASVSAVNANLTVTFKHLTKTVVIANSAGALANVTISDLSVNQAIKSAINTDPVLSKLLIATDGPARSLVVTSLIDGVDLDPNDLSIAFGTTGALSAAQSAAVPAVTLFSASTALSDGYLTTNFAQTGGGVAAVDAVVAATETAVVAWQAMTAAGTQTIGGMTITSVGAETAENVAIVAGGGVVAGTTITTAPVAWTAAAAVGLTNVFTSTTAATNVGDIGGAASTGGGTNPIAVTTVQGAAAVVAVVGVGAIDGLNSTSASDNIITGGTGNDVIVLGTTEGITMELASNEIVNYEVGAFGNDTVVHFSATNDAVTPAVAEVFTATFGATIDADNVLFDGEVVVLPAASTAIAAATAYVGAFVGTDWAAVDNLDGTVTFTAAAAGDVADVTTADFTVFSAGAGADVTVTASAPSTQGADAIGVVNMDIDQFDFRDLGGDITTQTNLTTSVATNMSIFVRAGTSTTAALTTALNADALIDDLVASTHVYVGYNTANVGSVYTVVDGVLDDDLVVTLVGTIDLADTPWSTLTVANFL